MKDIDILTLQINVYQLVILEELQNGKILENIADNYEYKYNNFMEMMSKNLNETMNNNNYVGSSLFIVNLDFSYSNNANSFEGKLIRELEMKNDIESKKN